MRPSRVAETEMNESATSPERALWCSVLDQAVADAVFRPSMKSIFKHAANPGSLKQASRQIAIRRPPLPPQPDKTVITLARHAEIILSEERPLVLKQARRIAFDEAVVERTEARKWLIENSKDFRTVCYLAGMDADAVHGSMQKLKRNRWCVDEITHKRLTIFREGRE